MFMIIIAYLVKTLICIRINVFLLVLMDFTIKLILAVNVVLIVKFVMLKHVQSACPTFI